MLRASSARRDAPLWGGQGGSLAQKAGSERLDGALREGEALRVELNALRQNLEKAEGDKTRVRGPARVRVGGHVSRATSATSCAGLADA